jgi:predicted RNase H-like nuclease
VPAKNKSTVRRALLAQQGIADKSLRNIDFVDAALCALTARHILAGRWRAYGDRDTGHIVVPANE